MKWKLSIFGIVAFAGITLLGCEKCDDNAKLTLAPGEQGFSVTILDSNGTNLSTLVPANQVTVFVSTEGPEGQYVTIRDGSNNPEDLSDGKFGPYDFVTEPQHVSKGVPYNYVYVIQKVGYKTDTIQVKFLAGVDECHEFWQQVEYYINPNLNKYAENVPDAQSGSPTAAFTIVN